MNVQTSPRKKRCPSTTEDELTTTPKKLRTQTYALPTPRSSASKKTPGHSSKEIAKDKLPPEFQRLFDLQVTLQQALSHALAISGISPTEDKGRVPNVINHLSIRKRGYSLDDMCRLYWLWQWDAKSIVDEGNHTTEDDNPFVEKPQSEKDWCQGCLGVIFTPTTQFVRDVGKRIPVYGIGIEVEMDIDKGFSDGMAAVARWTADGVKRKEIVAAKLTKWVELHPEENPIPLPPKMSLPALKQVNALKAFSLAQSRVVSRPSSPTKLSDSLASHLLSPRKSQSPTKSPRKASSPERQQRIPFPTATSPGLVPQTPQKVSIARADDTPDATTTTPTSIKSIRTPTSERRAALYDRVRQRSLSSTSAPSSPTKGSPLKEGFRAMSAALMRRRCLLGRLPNVAESIWMLFSGPASSSQERRALRLTTVVHSVVKSSSVPISNADAEESLSLLIELCPFFLQRLIIGREEWLEMPAPVTSQKKTKAQEDDEGCRNEQKVQTNGEPVGSPKRIRVPTSPGMFSRLPVEDSFLHQRSPRTLNTARGSLGQVRERIRKELESYD